jgi:hypothetical protein
MKMLKKLQNFGNNALTKHPSKPNLRVRIKFALSNFMLLLPYHLLVMGSVSISALIFKKWFEALMFLIAFFTLRYKHPITFHAKSIVVCMVLTNSMFALSVVLCPYANTYIFGALVFAYLDTFILWYIQSKENLRQDKECAELYAKDLEEKLKQYQNPHEDLLIKCRQARLSQRDTEIAIKYFVEKQTPKEIWTWLCNSREYDNIEWDSVYQLLWRIGKKIQNK